MYNKFEHYVKIMFCMYTPTIRTTNLSLWKLKTMDEEEPPASPTISSDDDRVDRSPPLLRLELNEQIARSRSPSLSSSEPDYLSSSESIIVISSSDSSGCESPVYPISVSSDDYSDISDTPSYWPTDEELDIGTEEYPKLIE